MNNEGGWVDSAELLQDFSCTRVSLQMRWTKRNTELLRAQLLLDKPYRYSTINDDSNRYWICAPFCTHDCRESANL